MVNTIEAQLERANRLKDILAKQIPNEYCGVKFDDEDEKKLMQILFGKNPQAVIDFYRSLRDNRAINQLINKNYDDIVKNYPRWADSIILAENVERLTKDENRTLFAIIKRVISKIEKGLLMPESFVIRNTDELKKDDDEIDKMSEGEYKRHTSGIIKELGGKEKFSKKFRKILANVIVSDYQGDMQTFLKTFSQNKLNNNRTNELVIKIIKQLFNINSKDESSVQQFSRRLNNEQHRVLTWFIYDELEKLLNTLPKITFEND